LRFTGSGAAGAIEVAVSDKTGWVSGMDLIGGDALRNYASRGCDCTFAQLHSWTDKRLRSDPGAVMKGDAFDHQPERNVRPIMVPRAQVGSLRDAYIAAHGDLIKVIQPAILADPGVISYR
jgi:hypothetical protein